jgi:hypothetical protein
MYKRETIALRKQGVAVNGQKESELSRIAAQDNDNQVDEAADTLLDNVEEPESEAPEGRTDTAETKVTTEMAAKTPEEREAEALEAELEQIINDERVAPRVNINILVTLFVVVLAVNVLKGGGAFRSPLGIECGSTGFWLANVFMIAWIVVISAFIRQFLLTKYHAKKRCGYEYVEGDIQWDERASVVYPCLCMFAGCFAGMFGVGTFEALERRRAAHTSTPAWPNAYGFLLHPILRRWYCKGSVDVGHGCSSCCFFSFVSMHDSIHQLHGNHFLRRFRIVSP